MFDALFNNSYCIPTSHTVFILEDGIEVRVRTSYRVFI